MTVEHIFDLSDILTITTGKLISSRHMEGIYDILGFLTGSEIYTHQIPRATKICAPWILQQYPVLKMVNTDDLTNVLAVLKGADERKAYVAEWVLQKKALYGDTLPLSPLPYSEDFSSPVGDLVEMMGPERMEAIIVVSKGE